MFLFRLLTKLFYSKEFDPEFIASKSSAAAGICSWVLNVMVFHYVFENVRPLKMALNAANIDLKAAMDKLNVLQGRIAVWLTIFSYLIFLI